MKRTLTLMFVALAAVLSTFVAGASAQYYPPAPAPVVLPAGGAELFDIENYADTVNENGVDVDDDKSDASPDVMFGGRQAVTAGAGGAGGAGGGHTATPLAHTGSETTTPIVLGAALIAVGGLAVVSSKRRDSVSS